MARGLSSTTWPKALIRPVRIASDCTGLATAELSLMQILEPTGGKLRVVFGCDILPASRQVMAAVSAPELILEDMLKREFASAHIESTALGIPGTVRVNRESADLDFYVAGVMCTPWSPKGAQRGFADANAETMTNFLKTIMVLRPRCAVMENVARLVSAKHRIDLQQRLSLIRGYTFVFRLYRTAEWGVPQVRERLYVIMLRTDALTAKARNVGVEDLFDRVVTACQSQDRPAFLEYLLQRGYPVMSARGSPNEAEAECRCSHLRACDSHPCLCLPCRRGGLLTRQCKWRKHTADFLLSHKKHRRSYLNGWRKVRQDPKLKQAPGYFELARASGLSVSATLSSPRERVLLQALATTRNLLSDKVVVDVSQSIHRKVIRSDGNVPTITTGSAKMLVAGKGQFLDANQCLALQGFDPSIFAKSGVRSEELHYMAGNAMSLPVIGSVLLAAGHVLNWGSSRAAAGGA